MEVIKKIFFKALLLAGIIFLLNIIYHEVFWKKDLENSGADLLEPILNAQDSADVIYLAESSNFTTHEKDAVKKSISEFTAEYFPGLVFRSVEKGAVHAGVYLPLINQIEPGSRVKTVIVTLNLRSFDASWIHSKLETSLMRSNIAYEKRPAIVNRFLMSLNAFDNKTEAQREEDMKKEWSRAELKFPYPFKFKYVVKWDSAMANGGHLKQDGSWDMPKIELACHFIKTYAFQIDTLTNPRIKDFDKIVKVCEKKGLNLVFNLLAENIQYADSLVGKDLTFLINQNKELLMKRYNKGNVIVVDNLNLVNGEDYIDQNWTTEHYNQRGRERIARNLAEHLKKIYAWQFIEK